MTTKNAVVTGAARGIGRAVAIKFLREGWNVWALVRDVEAAKAVEHTAAGSGTLRALPFDASSEKGVLAAVQALREQQVRVDALVNNAGVSMAAPLAKTSAEDFSRLMQINVHAPFTLCRELMPEMAQAGGGRVVMVASTAAVKGFRYTSAYCASKHALLGLTRSLALEYAAKHVTVNAVCPGWTETDMLATSVSNIVKATGRSEDDAREQLKKMTPLGRFVRPDEVAEVAYFLAASDAAKAITGAAQLIDGGETL